MAVPTAPTVHTRFCPISYYDVRCIPQLRVVHLITEDTLSYKGVHVMWRFLQLLPYIPASAPFHIMM